MAKCFSCGAETPLALRLPGLWSELPPDKRGRLPYCKAHEADAFARRDAATAIAAQKPTGSEIRPDAQLQRPRKAAKRDTDDTGQGALF